MVVNLGQNQYYLFVGLPVNLVHKTIFIGPVNPKSL